MIIYNVFLKICISGIGLEFQCAQIRVVFSTGDYADIVTCLYLMLLQAHVYWCPVMMAH